MATEFEVVDFSDQVRKNAESSLDTFKNIADGFADRQEIQMNQSRKLMSDLDAVISEVDDMHKEDVGDKIDSVKKNIAENIYQKKGRNGVRLNIKDLNSSDPDGFNYSREMRSLKNVAANSRLSKEMLLEFQKKLPNDQYFKSEHDRIAAAASFVNTLSNTDNLDQSQAQLRQMLNDEYRRYRDNAQEYIDNYVADQPIDTSTTTFGDSQGNLSERTSTFIDSLILKDDKGQPMRDSETGQLMADEEKLKEVANYALIPGRDINNQEIPTGITQSDIPIIIEQLRNKAIQSKEKVLSTKDQQYSRDLSDKNTISLTKSRDENINNTPPSAAEKRDIVYNDLNELIDKAQKGDELVNESFRRMIQSDKTTGNSFYVNTKKEFIDVQFDELLRANNGDMDIPKGFIGSEFQKEVKRDRFWGPDVNFTPGNEESGWKGFDLGENFATEEPEQYEATIKQIKEYLGRNYIEGHKYFVKTYSGNTNAPEIIDMSDPASKATLANLIIEGNNTMGIESFVNNTKEQIALSEKNVKDNQYMIPDQGNGRSLPSDRPEDDINTLNPLNLELDSLNKKS
jgi:hypothetical protein